MNASISNSPLVSVIIPVYNVEKYLKECLDSVVNQTYTNFEVVLVNDGSTDASGKICEEYANLDSRFFVLHQTNMGLSAARNAALDICKGKYIVFLDSDDYIAFNLIEKTLFYMMQDNLAAVIFEANIIDEQSRIIGERFHVYNEYTVRDSNSVLEMVITDEIGSQVVKAVYKKSCWENVRFPVGLIYEDIYTTFKAYSKNNGNVAFIQDKLYYYRMNSNGISLSPKNKTKRVCGIFMGFLEQYKFALENSRTEIIDKCFNNVVGCARNVLAVNDVDDNIKKNSKDFLNNNLTNIFKSKTISRSLKLKVFIELKFPKMAKFFRKTKK